MNHGVTHKQQCVKPTPVLAELLRTCVHPPTLLLRIEKIIREQVKASQADLEPKHIEHETSVNTYTKLYLTDGELIIQALLHRRLHDQPMSRGIRAGDVLEIHDYKVKKAKRSKTDGQVVFLGVGGCHVRPDLRVKRAQPDQSSQTVRGQKRRLSSDLSHHKSSDDEDSAGGFFRDDVEAEPCPKKTRRMTAAPTDGHRGQNQDHKENGASTQSKHYPLNPQNFGEVMLAGQSGSKQSVKSITPRRSLQSQNSRPESDDEDAFQTIPVDTDTIRKRRKVLFEIDQNVLHRRSCMSSPETISAKSHKRLNEGNFQNSNTRAMESRTDIVNKSRQSSPVLSPAKEHGPILRKPSQSIQNDPRDIVQPASKHSPPFHNLASLLHPLSSSPLPRKNYALTTLAIITWVSPSLISRPNNPFPPKRHIKIEDPSLYNDSSQHPCRLTATASSPPLASQKRGRGITLAVYDHAATFKPAVGTLALFRGVVMQRLGNGDCILNVYPRQRPDKTDGTAGVGMGQTRRSDLDERQRHGKEIREDRSVGREDIGDSNAASTVQPDNFARAEWYITDQQRIRTQGYDVDAVLKWWEQRQKELGR